MSTATSSNVLALALASATGSSNRASSWADISPYASVAVLYTTTGACDILLEQSATSGGAVCDTYTKTVSGAGSGNFLTACVGLYARVRVLPAGSITFSSSAVGSKIRLVTEEVNATITGPVTLSSAVEVENWPETQTIAGAVSVSNFPASQTVAGSVSVSNFPASQTVAGSVSVSNFPASQTVAGSVSVSNFPASQTVAGSVSVSNFPASFDVGNHPDSVHIQATPDAGTSFEDLKSEGGRLVVYATGNEEGVGPRALLVDSAGALHVVDTPIKGNDGTADRTVLTDANGRIQTATRLYASEDGDGSTWRAVGCDNNGSLSVRQADSWYTGITGDLPLLRGTDDGTTARKIKTTSAGVLQVEAAAPVQSRVYGSTDGGSTWAAAATSAVSGSLIVQAAGLDGDNEQHTVAVDSAGRLALDASSAHVTVWGADAGAVPRTLKTDAAGQLIVDLAGSASITVDSHPASLLTESDGTTTHPALCVASGAAVTVPKWAAHPVQSQLMSFDHTDSASDRTVSVGACYINSIRAWLTSGSGWLRLYDAVGGNPGALGSTQILRVPLQVDNPAEWLVNPIYVANHLIMRVSATKNGSNTDHIANPAEGEACILITPV